MVVIMSLLYYIFQKRQHNEYQEIQEDSYEEDERDIQISYSDKNLDNRTGFTPYPPTPIITNPNENNNSETASVLDDEFRCIICSDRRRDVVLVPCGHLSICLTCSNLLPEPKRCPVCRSDVTQIVKVYK